MAAPARSRPFAAPEPAPGFVEDYLLYLLARASAQASAQFHAVVKRRGIAAPKWRVLGALASGPRTVGTMAAMTLLQQPTLTKVLDRMADEDLIHRVEDAADRRRVSVRLTDKGKHLAAELIALAREHEARVLAGYSPREAADVKRTLKTLIARTGP